MRCCIAALAALSLANVAEARRIYVNVWRGETAYVRVPDVMEIEEGDKDGVALRYGAIMPVDYVSKPGSRAMNRSMDRVDFSVKDRGTRLAEIKVDKDAKIGLRKFGMVEVDISRHVLPPPKEWKYYLDLWQHPWAVARWHKVKPFSKEHYAAMRPLWEMLANAGQKTITTTVLDTPWLHQCRDGYGTMVRRVKHADGSWSFDYTVFDEYVEFARSCGLGPHISCYSVFPWGNMVNWVDEKGERQELWAKTEEMRRDYWTPFLKDFGKHLKEKGWLEDTFIALDERGPKDLEFVGGLIATNAPGLKLSMAGDLYPSTLKVKVDHFCQAMGGKIGPKMFQEAAARRQRGLVTTYYVCCMPWSPNTFMWSAYDEAFWLGVYPGVCGLDGFLRWAYNSWGENPLVDASFDSWSPGDCFLVYPDGCPSIRFIELRNGIVAAEKLRLLKEMGRISNEDQKTLEALFDPQKALQGKQEWKKIHDAISDFLFQHSKSWGK